MTIILCIVTSDSQLHTSQGEGRNCIPAALSFVYSLGRGENKAEDIQQITGGTVYVFPRSGETIREMYFASVLLATGSSLKNAVCYRKDKAAGTQFLPSPCDMHELLNTTLETCSSENNHMPPADTSYLRKVSKSLHISTNPSIYLQENMFLCQKTRS